MIDRKEQGEIYNTTKRGNNGQVPVLVLVLVLLRSTEDLVQLFLCPYTS